MHEASEHLEKIVNEGILRGISVAFDNKCYGSAVVLIYAGIDAMAFLSMPDNQEDVTRNDFVNWVDANLEFNSENQVSGLELYGARCGMVHNYGVFSKLSREEKVRVIGYVDESQDDIIIDQTGESSLVLISIRGFSYAFSKAIEKFVESVWNDEERMKTINERLRKLVQSIDLPEELKAL